MCDGDAKGYLQGRNMMVVFGFLNCEVILFAYDRGSWKQKGAKTHFLREELTFRSKRIEREKKKQHEKKGSSTNSTTLSFNRYN